MSFLSHTPDIASADRRHFGNSKIRGILPAAWSSLTNLDYMYVLDAIAGNPVLPAINAHLHCLKVALGLDAISVAYIDCRVHCVCVRRLCVVPDRPKPATLSPDSSPP
jgi:hypothetical protein